MGVGGHLRVLAHGLGTALLCVGVTVAFIGEAIRLHARAAILKPGGGLAAANDGPAQDMLALHIGEAL